MTTTDQARYTYRLRISNTARRALLAEWHKCRWVWNECVAASQRAYRADEKLGPAGLDKMLTRARANTPWLREGASVPQQQIIRGFGRSKAKALNDRKERVPQYRRAGMPKFKKKNDAAPTLNYTQNGFSLRDGRLVVAGGIEVRPVWSRELPEVPTPGAGVPRHTWALVLLVRRTRSSRPVAGDRTGERRGLGCDRDSHDQQRYARFAASAVR